MSVLVGNTAKRSMGLLLACFLAVATSAPLFAGGQTETATDEEVTISFWAPVPDDAFMEYYTGAAQEFSDMDNGIRVQFRDLPEPPPEIDTELNAAELAGNFPDVFLAYIIFMGSRGTRGDFADLSGYIAEWDEANLISDRAYELGVAAGRQAGIAFYPSPYILTYRVDHFEEVGLDPAAAPTTWEELESYAGQLVQRDSSGSVTRAGWDLPAIVDGVTPLKYIRQAGGTVVGPDGEPYLDNPANFAGLDFVRKLVEANVSIPHNFNLRTEQPFVRGGASMGLLTLPQIQSMARADSDMADKLAFGPPLRATHDNEPSTFAGNRMFTIGEQSQHKDEAWEFIKFLLSAEQVESRMGLGLAPPRTDLYEVFIDLAETDFERRLRAATLEAFDAGQGFPATPWSTVAMDHLMSAYEDVYHGEMTAEEALTRAQANTMRELD